MKDDTSDEGAVVARACDMILPDAELKEKLWAQICDAETKEPLKELTQKVMCFFQRRQQLNLLEPYFEKYYSLLNKTIETRNREFAEIFMNHMSPAFMARDSDLERFNQILKDAKPETEFFILFLKK